MSLQPGLKAILTHCVTQSDLATNWQNDVPVMATPVLLWLAEIACMKATDHHLPPGLMTLGFRHEMTHHAPTPEQWNVTVTAELIETEGKLMTYKITAHDEVDLVLSGRHVRAIVDRERFVSKITTKAATGLAQE